MRVPPPITEMDPTGFNSQLTTLPVSLSLSQSHSLKLVLCLFYQTFVLCNSVISLISSHTVSGKRKRKFESGREFRWNQFGCPAVNRWLWRQPPDKTAERGCVNWRLDIKGVVTQLTGQSDHLIEPSCYRSPKLFRFEQTQERKRRRKCRNWVRTMQTAYIINPQVM